MVGKCGGHPLAICVVGGILRERRSVLEWEKLEQNMNLYLMGNESTTDDGGYGDVRQVLGLSYDYLPYHLKPCLLYLARFPEDSDIDVGILYKQWIAEGMISSNAQAREETKMEVAERYLGELANRSMVQVQIDEFSRSRFKACRLHDLMREFALTQGEEDGFLRVMDLCGVKKQPTLSGSVSNESPSCSRLVIFSSISDDDASSASILPLEQLTACNELLSLILIGYDLKRNLSPVKVSNFKMFKRIRVLELQHIRFERKKLPPGIENLIHLRYLSLLSCEFDELLSCLDSFPYLETLSLKLVRLPNVSWKLKRLRHLCLEPHGHLHGKVRLDGMDLLETLDTFDPSYMDLNDLSVLRNLRSLNANIQGNEDLSSIIGHLNTNLNYLQQASLCISNCSFTTEQGSTLLRDVLMCHKIHFITFVSCAMDGLPEYAPLMAVNLVEIVFRYCVIQQDPMATMQKFSNLLRCNISQYDGKEMVCHATGFPQLRELKLSETVVTKLRVEEGALSNLARFRIGFRDDRLLRRRRYVQDHGLPGRLNELVILDYGYD